MTDRTTVIYVRISEDKTGEGLGVERQESECREHAERLGLTVTQVYVDNDLSASTGKRQPAFEELLAAKPPVAIVWHTDRLVRVSKDLERVLDLGLTVHAVQAGHLDLSTPAGRAVARTVTAWATYEGEQKGVRQRAAARQRAEHGKAWWSSRPFGYERDGAMRETEAVALRGAYQSILSGESLASVARNLNEAGFVTNKGNPWRPETLRPVLVSPRNAAIRTYRGEEIGPGAWEAIVDERTFRTAARYLDSPERRTGSLGKRTGLLSGYAACGVCAGEIRISWRGRKEVEGSYRAYSCRGKHCLTLRAETVDGIALHMLAVRMTAPDQVQIWERPEGDVSAEAELRQVEQELAEWAEDRLAGRVTRDQMLKASEALQGRQRALQGRPRAGVAVPRGLSRTPSPDAAREVLDRMKPEELREFIEHYFEAVTLLPVGRGNRRMTGDRVRFLLRGTLILVSGQLPHDTE